MKKILLLTLFLLFVFSLLALTGCELFEQIFQKEEPKTYTITVVANDPALGSVTGGGAYSYGEMAHLTATPNDGCKFVGWDDGVTSLDRYDTVRSDRTFTANFERIPDPTSMRLAIKNTFYWGETELFNEGQTVLVKYDNDTEETVLIADLQITGLSTDVVGVHKMTIAYKGFEYEASYRVYYAEIDASNIVFDSLYMLNEPMQISGYVIAKGENGKSANIPYDDERVQLSNFSTATVTHDKDKGIVSTRQMELIVENCYQTATFDYSVWYGVENEVCSATCDYETYQVIVTHFTFSANGKFELLVTKLKKGSINLTEQVYEEADFARMTWEQDADDPTKINLYYKKNALSQAQHIGYYNANRHSLTLFAEIFNAGLYKLEIDDQSFPFYRDE